MSGPVVIAHKRHPSNLVARLIAERAAFSYLRVASLRKCRGTGVGLLLLGSLFT